MKPNYHLHEQMYRDARSRGWTGWGGSERMAKAKLVDRYMALENAPKSGRLLEMGCGEGHHCRAFAQLGVDVTGLDISPTAIAWATEKSKNEDVPGRFVVADVSDPLLPLTAGYDVVIDGNCLHCIIGEDRRTFLGNAFRALSDGGSFFVSSLCSQTDASYVLEKDGYLFRHIASVKTLIAELEWAGFTVLASRIYPREKIDHCTVYARKQIPTIG